MNTAKTGKKTQPKKSLVRNSVQKRPKTVIIQQPEKCDPSPIASYESLPQEKPLEKSKFESPELNSALRIARKIEAVEHVKPRKVKSVSDVNQHKLLIVNEKAAKQVNFPYNQPIYKDLIPLCTKTQLQSIPYVPRDVPIHKDEEPSLSKFYTPKVLSEYNFQVPVQASRKTSVKQFDGFKLYRTIMKWY